MQLAKDRQVDADHLGDRLEERPGGNHESVSLNRRTIAEPDRADAAAGGIDPVHARVDKPDAAFLGALEHVHPKLLRAEPAAAASVQDRDRALGQIGKVLAN